MNKVINKLQAYLFIALGVFIPTSIAVTNLIIGLISLCWILDGNLKVKLQLIKESKWILAIFALITLYALGMLWGSTHLNASWQFQRLALLLMFPVLATINIDQDTIKKSAVAFLITTFISALLAISINNNIISPLSEYVSVINNHWANSAFIRYNYHNVLLSLSFALALYLIIKGRTKYRNMLILLIIGYAISIFTEMGRAGQVIFNLTIVFYIIYYVRKSILKSLAIFLLLISFQLLVYNSSDNTYKRRIDTASKIIKNNGDRGVGAPQDIRYVFVRESLNRIFLKPILGHGTGSFGTIFKDNVNSGHYFNKHTTPHNQYLYVWFELGILGLLFLLMIFYYQIRELLRKHDGIHRISLPVSFLFLMLVDSYLFIFTLTIAYIYLYTIYSRYESE